MDSNLKNTLQHILPAAISWAQQQAAEVLAHGTPLDAAEQQMARQVGVAAPDKVRLVMVPHMPVPSAPDLRLVALETGLLGPMTIGLALGHAVLICHGQRSKRLLSHELRHVYQYEQAGSIAAYLPQYLQQIAEVGYFNAPFEADARAHEIRD